MTDPIPLAAPPHHEFRVEYLRSRMLRLVIGWWPGQEHRRFRREAWREISRAIEDAYDESLRRDWREVEAKRADIRAHQAGQALRAKAIKARDSKFRTRVRRFNELRNFHLKPKAKQIELTKMIRGEQDGDL